MPKLKVFAPDERIVQRIVVLRNEKVMLDFQLADLYQVETRALKQAVRRNIDRFPPDFMFVLTSKEIDSLVSQNVIPSKGHLGGAVPLAFTEGGIAMLAGVLNSQTAIKMNIAIIRAFIMLSKLAASHQAILRKLMQMESSYEGRFKVIFQILNDLIAPKNGNTRRIGFRRRDEG